MRILPELYEQLDAEERANMIMDMFGRLTATGLVIEPGANVVCPWALVFAGIIPPLLRSPTT